MDDSENLFRFCAGIVAVFGIILVYWIPTLIARLRRHNNLFAIALFNLFFGWTIIGWIVTLIWAATDNVRKE